MVTLAQTVWPELLWKVEFPSHMSQGVAGFMSVSAVPLLQGVHVPVDWIGM